MLLPRAVFCRNPPTNRFFKEMTQGRLDMSHLTGDFP